MVKFLKYNRENRFGCSLYTALLPSLQTISISLHTPWLQVLGLDPAVELPVRKMRRNLLKLIGVGEFDKVRCSVQSSVPRDPRWPSGWTPVSPSCCRRSSAGAVTTAGTSTSAGQILLGNLGTLNLSMYGRFNRLYGHSIVFFAWHFFIIIF